MIISTKPQFKHFKNSFFYKNLSKIDEDGFDSTIKIKQKNDEIIPETLIDWEKLFEQYPEEGETAILKKINNPFEIHNIYADIGFVIYGNIYWPEKKVDFDLQINFENLETDKAIFKQINSQYFIYLPSGFTGYLSDVVNSAYLVKNEIKIIDTDTTFFVETKIINEEKKYNMGGSELKEFHAKDFYVKAPSRKMIFDSLSDAVPQILKKKTTLDVYVGDKEMIQTFAVNSGFSVFYTETSSGNYEITAWQITDKDSVIRSLTQFYEIADRDNDIICKPLYKIDSKYKFKNTLWINRSEVPDLTKDDLSWNPSNNPTKQYRVTGSSPAKAYIEGAIQPSGISQSVIGPPSGSKHKYISATLSVNFNNKTYNGLEPIVVTHLIRSSGPPSPYINISPKKAVVDISTSWSIMRQKNFSNPNFSFSPTNTVTDNKNKKIIYKNGDFITSYKVRVDVYE